MNDPTAREAYRAALVIILIGTAMASLFVASYSLALGRPVPRHVRTGLVGDPAREPALVDELEEVTGGGLKFRALVLQRAAEQVNEQLAPESAPPLRVVDVRPLPPNDPLGLVSFYVTIAATVLGFVSMFQIRQHASGLSLRAWLAFIGVLAVVGGLALTLVTGPLIHALPAPFPELWAALAAQIAVAALFNSTMLVLFGRWAIIPTWLMFITFGNAWSGGAVAPALLPSLYAFVGRFMPSGATVSIPSQRGVLPSHPAGRALRGPGPLARRRLRGVGDVRTGAAPEPDRQVAPGRVQNLLSCGGLHFAGQAVDR
ncbi:MAG: hypothetical protein JWP76_1007 [Dactylosporangium sp.]|nr:hypothetical protein [Dactylosporangium sp.]